MGAHGEGELGRASVPTVMGRAKPESPSTTQSIQSQIQQRLSSQSAQPVAAIFHYNDINIHSADGTQL